MTQWPSRLPVEDRVTDGSWRRRVAATVTCALSLLGVSTGALPVASAAPGASSSPALAPVAAVAGTPQAPTVLFQEGFENGRTATSAASALSSYVGPAPWGETYTSIAGYTAAAGACNGLIWSVGTASSPAGSNCGTNVPLFQDYIRTVGMVEGNSASNSALFNYTLNTPGVGAFIYTGGGTTNNGQYVNLGPASEKHFLLPQADIAIAQVACGTPALIGFETQDGATTSWQVLGKVNACTDPGALSTTTANGNTIKYGRFNAGVARLMPLDRVGFGAREMSGGNGGSGIDFALDNLRILDASPTVDVAVSKASIAPGETTRVTWTVTNTSDLLAKNGFGFTAVLPPGLQMNRLPNFSSTCTSATGSPGAWATAFGVGGSLAANAASCTYAVDAVGATAGTSTVRADAIVERTGVIAGTSTAAVTVGGSAAAGTPVPGARLFFEDFENGRTGTSNALDLQSYVGDEAQKTYFANNPTYRNVNYCSSTVMNGQSPAALGSCANVGPMRDLARLAGRMIGTEATNNATVNDTGNGVNPGNPATFFQRGPAPNSTVGFDLGPATSKRFVLGQADVASMGCAAPMVLTFDYYGTGLPYAQGNSPFNVCTDAKAQSATVNGQAMKYGRWTGDQPKLLSLDNVGLVLADRSGSSAGTGLDFAYDNIAILDVSPRVDYAVSKSTMPPGDTAVLTWTLTNTADLLAKNGWSFTQALPSGLKVASTPNWTSTGCTLGAAPAAGATSISASGSLPANTASCTVSVTVTTSNTTNTTSPIDWTDTSHQVGVVPGTTTSVNLTIAGPAAPAISMPANGTTWASVTTVSGTGTAGMTIGTVQVDGATVTCANAPVTVASDGTWSCTLPVPVTAAGSHTITATQVDGLGNASLPATTTITVQAPTTSFCNYAANFGADSSSVDNVCWLDFTGVNMWNGTTRRTITVGDYRFDVSITPYAQYTDPNMGGAPQQKASAAQGTAWPKTAYSGVPGLPIWEVWTWSSQSAGRTSSMGITVNSATDARTGAPITDYALVAADASTYGVSHGMYWSSPAGVPIKNLFANRTPDYMPNPTATTYPCRATPAWGTNAVQCESSNTANTGAPIAYAPGATSMSTGFWNCSNCRSYGAFGIMLPRVKFSKAVVGRAATSDNFTITDTDPAGFARTTSTGTSAAASLPYAAHRGGTTTLAEAISANGTAYKKQWSCADTSGLGFSSFTNPGNVTSGTFSVPLESNLDCTLGNSVPPVITTPTDGSNVLTSLTSVSGTGMAGVAITVYVDGIAQTCSPAVTVAADGTWTWTLASPITAPGAHTVAAVHSGVGAQSDPSNTVNVTVVRIPTMTKAFAPSTIAPGATSTMTITVANTNAFAATGAALTDTYPTGLVNTAAPTSQTPVAAR